MDSLHDTVLAPPQEIAGSSRRAFLPVLRGWLTPSFTDCLLVLLVVWLFMAGGHNWESLLRDGDTGWHIRVGEGILATGHVPRTDPFSFSKPNAPWYAWEWLSEIAMALLYRAMGFKGITLASGLLIAFWAVLLLRFAIWRGSSTLIALGVTLLAAGAASVHYLARPHLVTFLFLVAALWILEADRRSPTRAVWLLAPLTALWANLHGGFPVILVAIGGLAAGTFLEGLLEPASRQRKTRRAARYTILAGVCAIASVANPYGLELHRHIISYLRSDWIKSAVQEFQAPSFRSENVFQYEILLIIGLMVAGLLLARKRVVEPLWILIWAHFSLSASRHIPIFVIFAAPVIAVELSKQWRRWGARSQEQSVVRILGQISDDLEPGFRRFSLWPVIFILFLILSPSVRWPSDFPSGKFPTVLIGRNRELLRNARVFTDDQWGDYLIFLNYPDQKVFIDGRTDFYGAEIGDQYLALLNGGRNWRQVLERYRFDLVMVPESAPVASLLELDPGWSATDRENDAVIYTRTPGISASK